MKKIKVAFITLFNVKFIDYVTTWQPSLGVLYIASYTKKYLGDSVEFKIIDSNFEPDLVTATVNYEPDIVAISSMSYSYNYATEIAKNIKQKINKPVIIGGTHISLVPESLDKIFDFGIKGEGEVPFYNVLKIFSEKGGILIEDLKKIKGAIFYDQDEKLQIIPDEFIANLDDILLIDRELVDKRYFNKIYSPLIDKEVVKVLILTSRGCPYNCRFCAPVWKHTIRYHSARYIAEEINLLKTKYNAGELFIADDLFIFNLARLKELSEINKKTGLLNDLPLVVSIRANLATRELFDILKELNTKSVIFGLESGSDEVLRYLKRNVGIKDNYQAVKLCREYDFKIIGSFVIGTPTEKLEDMEKTFAFIKETNLDSPSVFVATPFPKTDFWDYLLENKMVDNNFNRWDLLSIYADYKKPEQIKQHIQNLYKNNLLLLNKEVKLTDFINIYLEMCDYIIEFRKNYRKNK
jgi:radical SAM superfamily enzyme YgiQ (UPF0313 family)